MIRGLPTSLCNPEGYGRCEASHTCSLPSRSRRCCQETNNTWNSTRLLDRGSASTALPAASSSQRRDSFISVSSPHLHVRKLVSPGLSSHKAPQKYIIYIDYSWGMKPPRLQGCRQVRYRLRLHIEEGELEYPMTASQTMKIDNRADWLRIVESNLNRF